MIKVGITGGIGSGKTVVSQFLERMGAHVYNTDTEAKRIILEDEVIRKNIIDVFGEDSYYLDEKKKLTYNRKHVGNIVFTDKVKLAMLNSIVQPAIAADAKSWNKAQEMRGVPLVYHESAIIIESGSICNFHKIVVVTSEMETRIRRIRDRDNCSYEEAMNRINSQINEKERIHQADYVIHNDFWGLSKLERDTISMHQQLGLLEVHDVPLRTLRPLSESPSVV